MGSGSRKLGLTVAAILLPPLAVFLHKETFTSATFWISILLTILGWIPGIIFALFIVWCSPGARDLATYPTGTTYGTAVA